ncbi:hypothetical protein L2E82_44646 [Cichorium intybus]|uniref:Uncharacterized protein n=1 Tax=Cichorium intybus TaxID=13427 RepID=A0ACB8ZR45_CICIN|nr:hypothetical protein L2E82_44646 [Cichorium intybus]
MAFLLLQYTNRKRERQVAAKPDETMMQSHASISFTVPALDIKRVAGVASEESGLSDNQVKACVFNERRPAVASRAQNKHSPMHITGKKRC